MTPRPTCWSFVIATSPVCSRTCSNTCASPSQRPETENIIFDGAHAAVARINLDGAPSARALDSMQSGNADILASTRQARITLMATNAYQFFRRSAVPPSGLEEAQQNLVALPGSACRCWRSAIARRLSRRFSPRPSNIRALGNVPANYKVLFCSGASLQFSMLPLNLMTAGATADYIVTGGWSQKAVKEAQRVGTVNIAGSTESENFNRIPRQDELKLTPNAAYVHMTTNNTLFGTEWPAEPAVGNTPLVADASSDMFSRPIEVSKYGLIYAGAQKNLGPSGVTLVIIREDLLQRSAKSLHTMLNYRSTRGGGKTARCTTRRRASAVTSWAWEKWAMSQGGIAAINK